MASISIEEIIDDMRTRGYMEKNKKDSIIYYLIHYDKQKKRIVELESKLSSSTKNNEFLREKNIQLHVVQNKYEEKLEQCEKRYEKIRGEFSKTKFIFEQKNTKIKDLKTSELSSLERNNVLENKVNKMKNQHNDLTKKHNDLIEQNNDLVEQNNDLIEQNNDLVKQHHDLVKQHHDLTEKHSNLVEKHNDLTEKYNILIEQYNVLAERLNNVLNYDSEETKQFSNKRQKNLKEFFVNITIPDLTSPSSEFACPSSDLSCPSYDLSCPSSDSNMDGEILKYYNKKKRGFFELY